jgi:shikimate kinase
MPKFIKKTYTVQDPGATTVHRPGAAAQDPSAFRLQESNVFFIGPRGSGKSTLAAELARALSAPCLDTDEAVAHRAGASIEDLVQNRGWEAFRRLEHAVLAEACREKGNIVATGGGIVLDPENRKLLQEHGAVFYLMADVGTLRDRLVRDPSPASRPQLTDLSDEDELVATLREREPLYMECLDFILQANKPIAELVEEVLTSLGIEPPGARSHASND